MTAQLPDRVRVRARSGHVEVDGLSKEDVEFAISLADAVSHERVQAREVFASHVNEAMLRENITKVSEASQRQVQRSAALRHRLVDEQGAEDYASLATLRDSTRSAARTWVSRMRSRHELFTVDLQGLTLIPSVQLTRSGDVDPLIAELVRPLVAAGLDGWSLWAWLTSPTGLLSGETPAEAAATNIKRASRAADRYAAELRGAQDSLA